MASETTVQTPAAIKLFVGNLPFDITEEDLQKLFIDFGNPQSVTILKRRVFKRNPEGTEGEQEQVVEEHEGESKKKRNGTFVLLSKGYGFVTFTSQNEAEAAAKSLHKHALNGREIVVEIARPLVEKSGDASAAEKEGGRQSRRKGNSGAGGRGRRSQSQRSQKSDRSKSATSAKSYQKQKAGSGANGAAGAAAKGGATSAIDSVNNGWAATSPQRSPEQQQKKDEGRRRGQQQKKVPREQIESKDSVFVSNLPFKCTSDDLKEIFTSRGFKVAEAHIAQRQPYRGRNPKNPNASETGGRSKGFGFVKFEGGEAEQKKAVDSLIGVMVEDREITVKVAMEKDAPAPAAAE